ncbi:hypothetical protein L2Y96_18070 [Luteibacter aegosomaticola]|uniref:hypothetical protein n=1 Tax=Luteibacter aegosomaticola TaxID=2911538 RepID=UPI001FFB37A2|nr:hypothetical protein [Luteibacter aegosomaticola]UPG89286.1 hypothetical protein L2Y96_18070 [Luteibacter aegosomaticola]
MDITRGNDGVTHLKLGPVERWVAGFVVTLLLGASAYIFMSITGNLEKQAQGLSSQTAQIGEIKTQQAVTNAQLQTLSQQLSDIPSLTRQMAELKVQTDRNTQDIHELQQVRHLK